MSDPNQPYPQQDPQQGPQQGSPYQSYQPQGGQQGYPQQYGQGYGAPAAEDPGRTLGIIGLVLSFFTALIGMIISIVAFRRSKKAGFKNTPALIGIIVGVITTIGAIAATIGIIALATYGVQQIQEACAQLGPGQHTINGTTFTCPG